MGLWIRTRRKAVADFAPIEVSACYTRSHVQLFCRMHRLLQMSKLSPGNIDSWTLKTTCAMVISTASSEAAGQKSYSLLFFWRYVHSGDTATCSGRVSTVI